MNDKTPLINIHKGIPEKLARITRLAKSLKSSLSLEDQAIILPLLRKEWKSEKQVLDFTMEIIEKIGDREIPGHLAANFDTQIMDAIASEETPEELIEAVFWQG